MISKTLNLLHVVTWIVAIVLAFIVVSTRDSAAPIPATSTLTVTSWDGTGTAANLRSELETYAREKHITLAQEVADFGNRGAIRHLYLVDGDPGVPGGEWMRRGIGDFGDTMTTVVHPLADAGDRSPLGAYDVFGDSRAAAALPPFFASRGMTFDTAPISRVGSVPRSVLLTLAALALLTVSVLGAVAVASTRRYAVARLHGLFVRPAVGGQRSPVRGPLGPLRRPLSGRRELGPADPVRPRRGRPLRRHRGRDSTGPGPRRHARPGPLPGDGDVGGDTGGDEGRSSVGCPHVHRVRTPRVRSGGRARHDRHDRHPGWRCCQPGTALATRSSASAPPRPSPWATPTPPRTRVGSTTWSGPGCAMPIDSASCSSLPSRPSPAMISVCVALRC